MLVLFDAAFVVVVVSPSTRPPIERKHVRSSFATSANAKSVERRQAGLASVVCSPSLERYTVRSTGLYKDCLICVVAMVYAMYSTPLDPTVGSDPILVV